MKRDQRRRGVTMKKLRVGMIGAGGIATFCHIPAFQQLNEASRHGCLRCKHR